MCVPTVYVDAAAAALADYTLLFHFALLAVIGGIASIGLYEIFLGSDPL